MDLFEEAMFLEGPSRLAKRLVHLAETLLPPTAAKLWGARDVGRWQVFDQLGTDGVVDFGKCREIELVAEERDESDALVGVERLDRELRQHMQGEMRRLSGRGVGYWTDGKGEWDVTFSEAQVNSYFEEDFIRCLRQRNCIGMVAEHGERGAD